ncbi:MAG TPA: mandelate racemase/muconate lactonizing enzyme family protein [Casimicrobiaceae bacterium]|nr:mandelate racemase/muconate lactonizing enzyme family protein [Casimicrobiaceae bacterium]
MSRPIRDARWHSLRISPKTCWSFLELEDDSGCVGVGEATLAGREAAMLQLFQRRRGDLVGRRPGDVDLSAARAAARSLSDFAVVSALDQALHDLLAQAAGASLAQALGGRRREAIAVYANINRGTALRTPEGFAARAAQAIADGFRAVKIAPFDGVELYGDARKNTDPALLDAALARIAAVRAAIGPDVDLMVDCHWRLNRPTAESVIRATGPQHLYWLECPVPETPEMIDTMRSLRAELNRRGVRLAGCEEMSLVAGFRPFVEAGACDVMMPDVKYVGGLDEMLAVADALQRRGIGCSPHNPSGPVGHAASLQVCAAARRVERLEMQYDETPLFDALIRGALPAPTGSEARVPDRPGLGVRLDPALVQRLRMDV